MAGDGPHRAVRPRLDFEIRDDDYTQRHRDRLSLRRAVAVVHEGTVAYAAPFTGFGNLVIVDHGAQIYTLYGYLSTIAVNKGDRSKRRRTGEVGVPYREGRPVFRGPRRRQASGPVTMAEISILKDAS